MNTSHADAFGIGIWTEQNNEDAMSEQEDGERRTKLVKAGVAVGIGSAAIVAALLYASKVKKPKRGGEKAD
ncbi:MAG: hypothetical protein H0W65_00585 [Sphingomonas sp.]|uniref:hypothetical protein n=1 Tax=Sphingomonas sp. TaxID=28214 RepID=UPI0017ED8A5A|nr:hypothetical protein [Sphingomonas sp.]MBA3666207.1 hypothetical protein [Sphingomonas sp.]